MVKTIEEILNHSIYDRCFSAEQKQEVTKVFEKKSYYLEFDGQQNWLVKPDGTPICEKYKIPDYMQIPEENLDLTARERARWKSGLPLEVCGHVGLSINGVPHKYNPLTFAHYAKPNSILVCDSHLENILVEYSNPKESTWLNNQQALSKLEYFNRIDPHHKKLWVLVVSHAKFYKKTQQAIKEYDVTVIEIGKRIHKKNYMRYANKLGYTLKMLNLLAKDYQNPTQQVLDYYNYYKDNQTTKNGQNTIYVDNIGMSLDDLKYVCGIFLEEQETKFESIFWVAG